jgi:hypothetical protein
MSRVCISVGMLFAALAFASWWTSHTILDSSRSRRVTDAVLSSAEVRSFVADHIAAATAPAALPAAGTERFARNLDSVLARRDIQRKLEQFVVDAHERLLGTRAQPAVLDQATVRTLVRAALPSISAADLAKVHAVTFDVPQTQALFRGREVFAHRFWLYFAAALILVAGGVALSDDRRSSVKLIGKWLIGITIAHLVVLWIIPVLILPAVTNNPWAHLVSAVAGALGAGIVAPLVVLAVVGIGCLFADRFIPSSAARG